MESTQNIKVSIGLPVYNGEKWIADTIDSLLAQSFQNLEVIVSDNASTDATQDICNDFAKADTRVKLLTNPENMGVTYNYNNSFHHSSGNYFKWAAAGDLCDKEFIQRCSEVLEERIDVVLCHPRTRLFFDKPGSFLEYTDDLHLVQTHASERFVALLSRIELNNAMNGLFRSEVLRQTILHRPFLGSDICLMAEIALRGKIHELPEFLFFRRMDSETATKLKTKNEVREYFSPHNTEAMLLQRWKHISSLFSVISSAPIALSEKLKCYSYILKKCYWGKAQLYGDVRELVVERSMRGNLKSND